MSSDEVPVVEELDPLEAENGALRTEIKWLKQKIQGIEDTLRQYRNSVITEMEEEEILPWHYRLTPEAIKLLEAPGILEHTIVFKRFLLGYAVCIDVIANKWLWYEWSQRLWVVTKGKDMLPLLLRLVAEFKSRNVNLSKNLTKSTIHLHDLIRNLKTKLVDFSGIQNKINQNSGLVPLADGKIMDEKLGKIRYRTKDDYFSIYFFKGKVKAPAKISLEKSINKWPEELEDFFQGVVIPNSSKKESSVGILCSQLYEIYREWCESNYIKLENRRRFIAFLEDKGFVRKRYTDGFHWMRIDGSFL